MKIVDDFLPVYQFKELQSIIFGNAFPWYYDPGTVYSPVSKNLYGPSQFTHTFYNESTGIISNLPFYLEFFRIYLKFQEVKRIKVNLNPKTLFHRKSGYHIDCPNVTTAVYYLNTNNGWTDIKGHGKVKSVSNRIVIFDSNLVHHGVTCTDEKRRVVLNFNYVPAL